MNSSRQSAILSVPKACLAASAALHERDGYAVVAHYGSVPGEIAVCMKSVGLADHSDYGVLELRGDREPLDRALIARFGDPPLAAGNARRLHEVWYLRTDAHHTLLVGPHAALASEAATEYGRDRSLPFRDIRASLAIVGIVGPRATRLLTAAGLTGKLPVGAIGTVAGDRSIVAILRESQRRYLALLRADAADDFWVRLLTAGEPLGAAFVGYDALTLLNASSSPEADPANGGRDGRPRRHRACVVGGSGVGAAAGRRRADARARVGARARTRSSSPRAPRSPWGSGSSACRAGRRRAGASRCCPRCSPRAASCCCGSAWRPRRRRSSR